jgi:hypothetical protein
MLIHHTIFLSVLKPIMRRKQLKTVEKQEVSYKSNRIEKKLTDS